MQNVSLTTCLSWHLTTKWPQAGCVARQWFSSLICTYNDDDEAEDEDEDEDEAQ